MLVDWALDAEWTPERTAVARNLAVWYLTHLGRDELNAEIAAGREYWMPEDAGNLPEGERGTRLASWIRDGLARTRLFYLEPAAGELAIQTGADLRTGTSLIKPPTPYGFLISPGGVGYTADGMQLIAAAWQPTETGWAASWFTDTREWLDFLVKDRHIGPAEPATLIRKFGFLRYVHTTALDAVSGDTARKLLAEGSETIVRGLGRDPGSTSHGAIAALCGAWDVFTHKTINLERLAPPPDVTARDREFGIIPSKITRGWIATADPARVWDYDAGPVR